MSGIDQTPLPFDPHPAQYAIAIVPYGSAIVGRNSAIGTMQELLSSVFRRMGPPAEAGSVKPAGALLDADA